MGVKTAAPLISSLSISFFYMSWDGKTCHAVHRYNCNNVKSYKRY